VGFVNLLQIMHARGIKRLVYASSSSVYGHTSEPVRTEGYEGPLSNPYALTKRMNEDFARVWATPAGIQNVGLRFFNVYGPGQVPHSPYAAVIPRFINFNPVVNGDGNTVRDFTFVGDACEAIKRAVNLTALKTDTSLVCNVGTGVGVSLRELLVLLGKTAKHGPAREGDVQISIANTDYARSVLGYQAAVSIKEGLKRTVEFYERERAHGQAETKDA
jgi:UDP-N-acetylglucosamine 4-epimerase